MPSNLPDHDRPVVQEPTDAAPSPVWLLKVPNNSAAANIAQSLAVHLHCPPVIAQILVTRGIDTQAAAKAFLHPTLDALLDDPANDPARMLGMKTAVERILGAVQCSEPILIYGDYDVDGTTATVLLKTTIERIGLAMEPQLARRSAITCRTASAKATGCRTPFWLKRPRAGCAW